MKLLAIETSGTLCGAAILEDEKLIDKIELENGLTHSQNLMPIIKDLLEKNNFKISDFETFVCDIGPGSFTGIRIGIATIKAFSDSLNIPCIGISSLEALAYNINNNSNLVCSILDCKNDNCYFALYEFKNGSYIEVESPCAKSKQEVLNLLNEKYADKKMIFVGNGIPEKSSDFYLDIYNLGIAGFKKFVKNNNKGEEILPLYLRKPQAQRQLEQKQTLK